MCVLDETFTAVTIFPVITRMEMRFVTAGGDVGLTRATGPISPTIRTLRIPTLSTRVHRGFQEIPFAFATSTYGTCLLVCFINAREKTCMAVVTLFSFAFLRHLEAKNGEG